VHKTSPIAKALLYLAMLLLVVVFLFPLAWNFVSSLKPEAKIVSYPPKWIPDAASLDNYAYVLKTFPFIAWMKNSIIVAVASTVFVLLLTAMAAYAFAWLEFRGKRLLFTLIVSMLLIPVQASMVPLFLLSSALKLLNTRLVLILVAGANVTGVFILTSFFRTIPRELEEAAYIDGCGSLGIFYKIVLPLSTAALSSVAILTFIANWNSFLWPLIVLREDAMKTLPVGIAQFMGGAGTNAQFQYGPSLAAAGMALVPSVIVFLALQRNFVEGISNSGIKG
jgi:ABC-type glycerol-3-phosphate transport system permease component